MTIPPTICTISDVVINYNSMILKIAPSPDSLTTSDFHSLKIKNDFGCGELACGDENYQIIYHLPSQCILLLEVYPTF